MMERNLNIDGVGTLVELPKELDDAEKLSAFLSGGERFASEAGHFAKLAAEYPILGAERRRRRNFYFAAVQNGSRVGE